ncbi:Helix-turn-helix domain [Mycobacteroides abscessus subsp. massiliense]|uniref:helix-turn-helix domain-containing protein n=1 Tax=Mycobacteroides TaxID=670516 RepID=UPI0009288192|nr:MULTISPECIES: helix-turn-helix domain-containing protein [Mycobacteroides]MBV0918043.1 helix-turn-helix domain-containing protein [Mycobacteroides chelonae]RIT59377.1 DNA-binding protein [Mycobacteroides abscessus]RIU52512.1 DNA-binding protein [Mycobacteroides abscessus]SHX53973.1 Helix-turn-helix domain [Mycobacteroides abscessus subsp. abscessus]SKM76164.1 Helix-turn-helix domain [Mycobacteroides abscessus subsp. massiliense]
MARSKAVPAGDEYLTPGQVSATLQVSRQTLSYWRSKNTGPLSIQVGSSIRYPRHEFEAWLAMCTEQSARGERVSA